MADERERAAFEEWARSQTADKMLDFTPCTNTSCRCGFHYLDPTTAWTFSAWQAQSSRIRVLEEALREVKSALEVLRTCLKADTGDVGEYWSARKWLRDHNRYEGNLQELAVPLEVSECALLNMTALLGESQTPHTPKEKV